MTARDAYWGAKIVMAFRDEHLQALVKTGQYSNPEAEAYLLKTLKERRDKIGRHWFGEVNPLDDFKAAYNRSDLQIRFEDLAVKYTLERDDATYQLQVRYRGKDVIGPREFRVSSFALSKTDLKQMMDLFPFEDGSSDPADHLFEIRLRTQRNQAGWSKPTVLWLWLDDLTEKFRLAGVEHMD
jgi:hypothetical protein